MQRIRVSTWLAGAAAGLAVAVLPAAAQMIMGGAMVYRAESIEPLYKDAPGLPQGVKVAVLEGDLGQAGPFTFRMTMPAGTRIPPHTHPTIEHVTVLSGAVSIGHGRTFEATSMQALGAGALVVIPPNTPHFASATEASVLQLHGMGPWGITYVNPQDDPRLQQR